MDSTGDNCEKAMAIFFQPCKDRYLIYGGSLSDSQPPTRKDKCIAFWIDVKAAK